MLPRWTVGCADHFGAANMVYTLEQVRIADGLDIPLRIHYLSSGVPLQDSGLGPRFWCPLFDAHAVEESEHRVRVHLPDASAIDLYKRADAEGQTYRSSDGKWTGVRSGGDFSVNAPTGEEFLFKDGLLSSLKLRDDHGKITWKRSASEVDILFAGKRIARVERDAGTHLYKSAEVDAGREGLKRFTFAHDEFPIVRRGGDGNAVPIAMAKSLSKIAEDDRVLSFTHEYDHTSLNPVFEMKVEGPDIWLENGRKLIKTDGCSGLLVADDVGKYSFQYAADDRGQKLPIRIGRQPAKPDAPEEFYEFDKQRNSITLGGPTGEIVRRVYVAVPGSAYGNLSRVEVWNPSTNEFKTVATSAFDSEGRVIREILPGAVHNYIRRENEVKFVRQPDSEPGKEVWVKKLSDEGELMQTQYGDGVSITYTTDATGKKIAKVKRGSVEVSVPVP